MPSKKKKFIDKKHAVTFHLVHRSQKDPLTADETAPQRVLLPPTKEKSEEQKYGIYFDDNYDYLQHLKDVDEVAEWEPIVSRTRLSANEVSESIQKVNQVFQLPSSVFQSNVEEKVGLLNKAATVKGPRPDLDPDIVAALDDDFDFENPENELEDDFMDMANGGEGDSENEQENDSDLDDDFSDSGSVGEKSRFTNYSMSSSVIPRSEILQTLDDRFEKIYEQYDEEEIGGLDGEEISGFLDPESDMMKQLLQDHEKNWGTKKTLGEVLDEKEFAIDDIALRNEGDDLMEIEVTEKPGRNDENKWDCESILSTYSNIYNRPKLIKETNTPRPLKINHRTGIPENVLNGGKQELTKKTLKILSENLDETPCLDDVRSIFSKRSMALSVRDKSESLEQKKERKTAVKELRKERRLEKKANKEAFKNEELRQAKIIKNLKENLQGIKIV